MKTKMNVLKNEAEQIWFSDGNKFIHSHYGLKNKDTTLFIYNCKLQFSNDNVICMDYKYSSEYYKDYEWRLTDIKDLEQGDICKVLNIICVFDEPHPYMNSNNLIGIFWKIQNNRPFSFNGSINSKPVLKLFKKVIK